MTTVPTQETSGDTPGKTQEVVAQAQEKVEEKTDELRSRASVQLRSQVETRSTQAGQQLESISEALRKGAEHLHGEGNEAGARSADKLAEQTRRLSSYLSGSNADKLLSDGERFARKRPWLVAGIGAAVGFVGARFLKASSENRYQISYREHGSGAATASDEGTVALSPVATPGSGSR